MKVLIEKIKFDKTLYPRFEADNSTVNQYRQAIDQLPPIILTKDNVLVDGYHRLLAYKLEGREEIEAEFIDCADSLKVLLEAIRRNSTHGKQLSMDEKRKLAPKLYEKGTDDLDKIKSLLSVIIKTVGSWTKDLRDKEKEERDSEIFELYLQCYSYREIAEKLGIGSPQTIGNILSKNGKFSESGQLDNIQLYNVWGVGKLSPDQLKYPGQTPYDVVENIVYYYSDPPQTEPLKLSKVIDPMAGSGIIRDVCRKLLRRYMLFDLKPLREDIPIEENNILEGFPDKAKRTDLVYLDPPYYNLMEEYPRNEFNESYESFLNAMKVSLGNIRPILNDGGRVALILKPMNEEMLGGDWFDMTFDCVTIARDLGYKLIKRICVPPSTQQFNQNDVKRAKERRVMLNTLRDIVIFERCKQ